MPMMSLQFIFLPFTGDEMRYKTPAILILLQDLLFVRRGNEYRVFTLEYRLLSSILKSIGYKDEKCRAPTFRADQPADSA